MTVRRLLHAGPREPSAAGSTRRGERVRPAFTIVELLVVLAIIAVSAAIAIPRYGDSIARFRIESAARRVGADLGYARSIASGSSASTTVAFNVATEAYTVGGAAHMDTRAAGYLVRLAVDPYYAAIVSADFGGDAQVMFDGYGRPDSGGSVLVRNGAAQWRIAVEAESGAIGVQRVP